MKIHLKSFPGIYTLNSVTGDFMLVSTKKSTFPVNISEFKAIAGGNNEIDFDLVAKLPTSIESIKMVNSYIKNNLFILGVFRKEQYVLEGSLLVSVEHLHTGYRNTENWSYLNPKYSKEEMVKSYEKVFTDCNEDADAFAWYQMFCNGKAKIGESPSNTEEYKSLVIQYNLEEFFKKFFCSYKLYLCLLKEYLIS